MDLQMIYLKERKEFGRAATHLSSTEPEGLGEFEGNETLISSYAERNRVTLNMAAIPELSEHWVEPETIEYTNHGMNHTEGGWPKDLDYTEKEQTTRYRKKVEKDEEYIRQIRELVEMVDSSLMQNVAIDIYEDYFAAADGQEARAEEASSEAPSAKTLAAFKDPSEIKRTACQISWFPDGGKRFSVAFSIMQFQDWRIDKARLANS